MIREVEAVITAVTTVSGQYRYGWRQIFPAAVGGATTDAITGLIGSTTLNYAVERNNISVGVGARVTLQEYGFVGNQIVWVFSAPAASAWKTPPVRAATTTTLPTCTYANGTAGVGATLTGNANGALAAQDGVTLAANDDLLVKNESTQANRGIYTLTQVGDGSHPFILTRRGDADTASDLLGATVVVTEGTANADTVWLCTANAAITVGTTALPWIQIGATSPPPPVSAWKEPVRAATTTNGTLATAFENGDTVDGVTLVTGDRILLKNQTTGSQNGIYTVNASGAPTRATDMDADAEVLGTTVAVMEGTANADTVWLCTTNGPITLGTTALTFVKIAPFAATGVDELIARYDGTTGIQASRPKIKDNGCTLIGQGNDASYESLNDTLICNGNNSSNQVSAYFWGLISVRNTLGTSFTKDITLGDDTLIFDGSSLNDTYTLTRDHANLTFSLSMPASGRFLIGAPSGAKYAIHDGSTAHNGITTTCTVVVSGVNKTMTIKGGIVTDIS